VPSSPESVPKTLPDIISVHDEDSGSAGEWGSEDDESEVQTASPRKPTTSSKGKAKVEPEAPSSSQITTRGRARRSGLQLEVLVPLSQRRGALASSQDPSPPAKTSRKTKPPKKKKAVKPPANSQTSIPRSDPIPRINDEDLSYIAENIEVAPVVSTSFCHLKTLLTHYFNYIARHYVHQLPCQSVRQVRFCQMGRELCQVPDRSKVNVHLQDHPCSADYGARATRCGY
jgi:hypothetical protein